MVEITQEPVEVESFPGLEFTICGSRDVMRLRATHYQSGASADLIEFHRENTHRLLPVPGTFPLLHGVGRESTIPVSKAATRDRPEVPSIDFRYRWGDNEAPIRVSQIDSDYIQILTMRPDGTSECLVEFYRGQIQRPIIYDRNTQVLFRTDNENRIRVENPGRNIYDEVERHGAQNALWIAAKIIEAATEVAKAREEPINEKIHPAIVRWAHNHANPKGPPKKWSFKDAAEKQDLTQAIFAAANIPAIPADEETEF